MPDVKKIGIQHPQDAPVNASPEEQLQFWHALIDEKSASKFLGLSVRTLQGLRQRGGSPAFIRVSGKAVRYRRVDLSVWADGRLQQSTWQN